jgi:TonB family protein
VAGHALVVTALLLSPALTPEPMVFESFQVTLVSPPAEVAQPDEVPAPPEPELVVETPDPEPQPEEPPPPPPPVEPDPTPAEPEPERPPVEQPPPEPEPPPPPPAERPPASTEPVEEPRAESGVDINVRLEGLRRDFPVYYANIIRQINVCFRPPQRGNHRTVVHFEIRADGTVTGSRLVERSGHAPFDYAALGAIECAGDGRFGPLPDELPYDRLPVQFTFEPKGQ